MLWGLGQVSPDKSKLHQRIDLCTEIRVTGFDRLSPSVDAFYWAIIDLQNDDIEGVPLVILDSFGGLFDGLSTTHSQALD